MSIRLSFRIWPYLNQENLVFFFGIQKKNLKIISRKNEGSLDEMKRRIGQA
jgi:hypothetical protein